MSMTLDTSEFQAAVREHLTKTSRALDKATNARMFYLMLRVFALLPPRNPQAERNKVREYLDRQIGERVRATKAGKTKRLGKGRQLRLVHLIVQARRKRAGQGVFTPREADKMKDAAAAFRRRSIGAVGYLKSPIARALKKLNGHFTQFGFKTKKSKGREVSPNAALVKIAAEYGLGMSNVSMHGGSKASVRPARPSLSPVVSVNLSLGLADGQHGKVSSEYNAAMSRAMIDEIAEMRRHVGGVMQDLADEQKPK